ncbi:MAG TPA: glycosyl hydrolase family 65 protein, partial [Acidimicrobiales bacterium]|nr:glycosyl hydrolase family 65 protein [Acidimicrobiales bacterium]
AGVRAEARAIPAKGLTGPGYDGHAFWDTEIFILSVLTYTAPEAVAHALRWRYETLPLAKERALQLGLKGAAFPWRTISGAECSAYWPAGTAAFHVGADIASAVVRYIGATGDEDFARGIGLELLVETARLWRSLGHHDVRGRFCIDGVTGPDEYSAMADNNVYTNLMAQHNLLSAAEFAATYPDESKRLHIDQEEMAGWRDAAKAMHIPYDNVLKIHPQADDFTNHEVWDFEATTDDQYPLLLHFPYFNLYRKQVVKQADLVLAMQLCPDAFTQEEKARNFVHYEALTVRDSSLSACSQAVIAAEVGYVELAHQYLAESALIDLDDLEHNTREGLHLAACAGTWIALTGGLAGMRERKGTLSFAPHLPEGITRLAFTLTMLNRRIHIEITPNETSYRLVDGEDFKVLHYNKPLKLTSKKTVSRPTEKLAPRGHPTQPRGREPLARRRSN